MFLYLMVHLLLITLHTLEDQESSAVSISFTAGGVAISASHQTTDNVAGATATDNTSYEVNFSFAF